MWSLKSLVSILWKLCPRQKSKVKNLQRAITPKIVEIKLWFLYTVLLHNVTCLCMKFEVTSFSGPADLGMKFYKNTEKSSLYSQSLLIFIHKTPVVESHPTTREIRDLLWARSTPMGNTVYFYMSTLLIYILKIHRRSFKHSIRCRHNGK